MRNTVALIGLGAIGTPIAHKLNNAYGDNFSLIAGGAFRKELENSQLTVNGQSFSPKIISDLSEIENQVELLIVCVKNYDLKFAVDDIRKVVTENTVILPLQNGIYSYKFFCRNFPDNQILQGYVQGPNTRRKDDAIEYDNPGEMHIGKSDRSSDDCVYRIYEILDNAGVDVTIEQDIRKMVWKKWMLNVAGNSVTALTGADYSMFKDVEELQQLCRQSMAEFLEVAAAENIGLANDDIEDIINYYVTYSGNKKTSMLEDVLNHRKTENEYLAGELLNMADNFNLDLPITKTLYSLVSIKEKLYSPMK